MIIGRKIEKIRIGITDSAKKLGGRLDRFYEEKIYCPPEKDISRKAETLGIMFRGAVIFCALFGILHLIYQSVGLYDGQILYTDDSFSLMFMLGVSLIFTVSATAAPVNRVTKIVFPLGTFAVFTAFAFARGKAFVLIENALRYLWNAFVVEAARIGYLGMLDFGASASYDFGELTLIKWSAILIAAVCAALLSFCVARRSNTPVFLVTVLTPVVAVFFFDLEKGNLGICFVIAAIAGFLSMRIVDARYGGGAERKQRRRRERMERRRERFEEHKRRDVERLRVWSAANRIYDMAISAGMSANRAKFAYRAALNTGYEELRDRRAAEKLEKKEKIKTDLAEKVKARKAEKEAARLERKQSRESRKGLNKYERVSLRLTEKAERYRAGRERREAARKTRCNHAAGGYAAATASVIALVAMAVPFIFLKTPFPKIAFLDRGLDAIRSFAADIFYGDGVDLTTNPYAREEKFGYEKIDFSPRSYKGITIFRVEAPLRRTVYLKSRTATDFDVQTDTWSFADEDDVVAFADRFGSDFTPDSLTAATYSFILPVSTRAPFSHSAFNYERYGFAVEQVHVMRKAGGSGILLMPYLSSPLYGVLEYDSGEESSKKVSNYFDGIYTSRYFKKGDTGFSTYAYVYDMRRLDLEASFDAAHEETEYVYSLAKRALEGEDEDELLEEYYEEALGREDWSGLGDRYFTRMTRSEKSDFIKNTELCREYAKYAEETYARPSGSAGIKALSDEIAWSASEDGEALSRYETVKAVIDYLTRNYEYSLTPPSPDPESEGSAIEAFLFETKCGYCSHFATSACLLLRDAGIPVRYTEGYHVSRLYSSAGAESVDVYGANVLDSDSHTWIEVYFDYVGWVPFEATVTFTEYVEKSDDPEGELLPDPWENREEIEKERNSGKNDSSKDKDADLHQNESGADRFFRENGAFVIVLLIVTATAGLAVFTVVLVKKSAEKAVVTRARKLRSIKDGTRYKLGFAKVGDDAEYLIDSIFKVFAAADLGPAKGEQLSELASRLETDYNGISKQDINEVMELILKEEYGHGLTEDEAATLASFLDEVIFAVYLGMTRLERIKYRYILRII